MIADGPKEYGRSESATRRAGEQGLTMIEMLVSMLLLSFVALGAVSLLSATLHQNKLARYRSLATHLAAERIEQLTSQRWASAADYLNYQMDGEVVDAGPPITFTADYGTIDGHPEFRRILTLSYDTPFAGILYVVAEATWEDLLQGEKRHTMTTYVHPGLEQGI